MKSGRSVSQGCSANWRKLSKQSRVGIWLRVSALGCSCLPTVSLTHSLSTWCEAGVTIWGCHLSFKKGILCRNLKQCNSRQVLAESIRLFCLVFFFVIFFPLKTAVFQDAPRMERSGWRGREGNGERVPGSAFQVKGGRGSIPRSCACPSGGWGLALPFSSGPGTQSCFLPGNKLSTDDDSHWEPRAPRLTARWRVPRQKQRSQLLVQVASPQVLGATCFQGHRCALCSAHSSSHLKVAPERGFPRLGIWKTDTLSTGLF